MFSFIFMQENRKFEVKEYNSYPVILVKQVSAVFGELMKVFTEFLSSYIIDR